MLATAQDTEYFSKQWLYMKEGVSFTTILKLCERQNFGYLF